MDTHVFNFIQENNNEQYNLQIINNKIKIFDTINNINIIVQKILNPFSKKNQLTLFFLGYNKENIKLMLQCKYKISLFKYKKILLIITTLSKYSPMIMYKYTKYKKKLIYNCTLLELIKID